LRFDGWAIDFGVSSQFRIADDRPGGMFEFELRVGILTGDESGAPGVLFVNNSATAGSGLCGRAEELLRDVWACSPFPFGLFEDPQLLGREAP
jgi:hypothetical protein